jgi:hypothetical protein
MGLRDKRKPNKLEKIFFKTLFCSGLFASIVSAKIHPVAGLNLGFGYSPKWIKITNVSRDIRSIPRHPDDGGGLPIELEKDSLEISYGSVPFFVGGLELVDSRAENKLQLFVNYELNASFDRVQYNYRQGGTGRGTGAALIYYEVVPQNYLFSWTKTAELERIVTPVSLRYDRKIVDGVRAAVQTRGNIFKISLQNGWDRYNSDQVRKEMKIADVFQGIIDLSTEIRFKEDNAENGGYIRFSAGVALNKVLQQENANVTVTGVQPFFEATIGTVPLDAK